jgi:hypothetical protein
MLDVNVRRAGCSPTRTLDCGALQSQRAGRGGIVLNALLDGQDGTLQRAQLWPRPSVGADDSPRDRAELARHGVDVLAAAPGPVASGFAAVPT